jgi:predicted RNA-binding Zn-ribbon protein involved in translation (DUF1610 family)
MSEPNKIKSAKQLSIVCPKCGHLNVFNQPYAYHAGFGNQGFLYNDDGNLTLTWSVYDPDFRKLVANTDIWGVNNWEKVKSFEDWLPSAPHDGRWRFGNPARCLSCKAEISPPMGPNIYYVLYEGSIQADSSSKERFKSLKDFKEKFAS